MYENRVENDRKILWNSHSFILWEGSSAENWVGKFLSMYIYVILNFPILDFFKPVFIRAGI